MKKLSLDFDNYCLCIMTQGQEGTEIVPGLQKEAFKSFIPEKYWDKTSFTWNFETERFIINKPYKPAAGTVITEDCFVPETVEPMPGLADRFDEFIKALNYESVNIAEELANAFPEVASLFGL